MRKRITLPLLCGLILLSAGCEPQEKPEIPERPGSYTELLDAYRCGAFFVSAEIGDESSLIVFSDRELSVPKSEIELHDCSRTNRPPIVYVDGQGWMIQGRQTHIPDTRGQTEEDSYPLYLFLYENTLHLFVSNNVQLDYPAESKGDNMKPEVFAMPEVHITHQSDRIHKSYPIEGTVVIEDPDRHYSATGRLECSALIQGRGNSTWGMPKQPFKIKLAEKHEVLGMPAKRNWVFLANYADKSLLRNALAMKTSEISGMDWTPRYRIAEVWINGQYQGVYNIFEKKEVAAHKVDIDLNAGDSMTYETPTGFWKQYRR